MSNEGSVAPKERVNIVYRAAGDGAQDVELPLKIVAIGDYTGKTDTRPLEERSPISIAKDNFDEVLAQQDLGLELSVPNRLSGDEGDLSLSLRFEKLNDFSPEGLLQRIPELCKLMELREALSCLKSPLGNKPSFRRRLQQLMDDDSALMSLLDELGIEHAPTT
jgi:type VI secretion system protein ImpB